MNGRRVRRHVMKDGEVIHLGRHELRYDDARASRALPREAGPYALDTAATGPQEAIGELENSRSAAK